METRRILNLVVAMFITLTGSAVSTIQSNKIRIAEYSITLRGGEEAYILLGWDGDTEFELYIYDENGELVASSTDRESDYLCKITPKWTANYRIRLLASSFDAKYKIITNDMSYNIKLIGGYTFEKGGCLR